MDTSVEQSQPEQHAHLVEITVNGRAVQMADPKATGLAIKEAAIAQGVPIKLDFILSEEIGPKKTRLVRDDAEVSIHPHAKFVAIPNDDNS